MQLPSCWALRHRRRRPMPRLGANEHTDLAYASDSLSSMSDAAHTPIALFTLPRRRRRDNRVALPPARLTAEAGRYVETTSQLPFGEAHGGHAVARGEVAGVDDARKKSVYVTLLTAPSPLTAFGLPSSQPPPQSPFPPSARRPPPPAASGTRSLGLRTRPPRRHPKGPYRPSWRRPSQRAAA